MAGPVSTPQRLWRVRRRLDRIDAVLEPSGRGWSLQYFRNGRRLLSWPYRTAGPARAAAAAKLRELQRAGWTSHW